MLNGTKLKGGFQRIHCSRCPTRLTYSGRDRAAFAEALEDRGWRIARGNSAAGAQQSVVCPDCAKKLKPEEVFEPKRAGVTT